MNLDENLYPDSFVLAEQFSLNLLWRLTLSKVVKLRCEIVKRKKKKFRVSVTLTEMRISSHVPDES
jgi:hypothetical protein